MKTDNINSPNFEAQFVNRINIGKLSRWRYAQVDTSFVKLDRENIEDLWALQNIADSWRRDKYANYIYQKACAGTSGDIFALTTQTSDFETLNSDNVLGICEIAKEGRLKGFLDYLQVKPDLVYNTKPMFKGVGSAILASLKHLYNEISLVAADMKRVKNFYKRNEFQENPEDSCYFTWYKDVLNNFVYEE